VELLTNNHSNKNRNNNCSGDKKSNSQTHIASYRGSAVFRSLSERSGHSSTDQRCITDFFLFLAGPLPQRKHRFFPIR